LATLLHLYCPGKRPETQADTWEALALNVWPDDLRIVHCPGPLLDDNGRAVSAYWDDPGDLLIIEQDIVPSSGHVGALRECPRPFCAWDFIVSGGRPWSSLPDGSGIGLCKIAPGLRASIRRRPMYRKVPWMDLAAVMFAELGPVHVHRPLITHRHYA
jgi:hypothetical protein